jgi:hypothetical protein
MRARTFLVGMVAAVLVATLTNVSWADGRGKGWHAGPAARVHHGWHGHPYRYHGYGHYHAPRPVYLAPPAVVYIPAPGPVYAPVSGPVYGGGYISSGIWVPGLSLSFSARLP